MRLQAQAGFLLFVLITATIAEAQTAPRQRLHATSAAKPSASVPVPAPEVPQAPLSLLERPANPASVEAEAGKLFIKADNSSLTAILHDISSKTGMTVEGQPRDQRIFGNYGPANPREVLSALLDGIGYNVMMVGALSNGVPRQLILSTRTGSVGPRPATPIQAQQNANQSDDQDDSTPDQPQEAPPQPPRPEPNPPEGNKPPEQPGQVKTPQQLLQELQQMRQQQQQQANPQ